MFILSAPFYNHYLFHIFYLCVAYALFIHLPLYPCAYIMSIYYAYSTFIQTTTLNLWRNINTKHRFVLLQVTVFDTTNMRRQLSSFPCRSPFTTNPKYECKPLMSPGSVRRLHRSNTNQRYLTQKENEFFRTKIKAKLFDARENSSFILSVRCSTGSK